jgi:hypothetical protein
LEYIDFMKIGQPNLSKRTGQRKGLFSTPTTVRFDIDGRGNDYEKKAERKGRTISDPAFNLCAGVGDYFLNLLLTGTKPTKPGPRSQAAVGMGTGVL